LDAHEILQAGLDVASEVAVWWRSAVSKEPLMMEENFNKAQGGEWLDARHTLFESSPLHAHG